MQFALTEFLVSSLIITLGATLQAATGLGAGLVVVPMLALVNVELVPGPVIFASLFLSFVMAYRGRREVVLSNFGPVLVGLSFGMVVGAYSIAALPVARLGIVFGLMILVAVAVSSTGIRLQRTPMTMVSAGAVSGFMGTVAAIGAPVLAMLYQHERGPALRATLGALYFVSSVAMLVLLHLAGVFGVVQLALGAYLVPGFLLGYLISAPIARMLDRGYTRIAVLLLASLSALTLIVKSLGV